MLVDISTWDIPTWASFISATVTVLGILIIVGLEWYRRPRLRVKPSDDRPTEEWIHLTVRGQKPGRWFLPRDIAVDCVARASFLNPATFPASEQELVPQITAHWVNQPEPRDYTTGMLVPSLMPTATTRNVGFRDEMIDVLRRLPDGTADAADPWKVYAAWPPAEAPAQLQADFEERRLKQHEHIVRVELEPANGWPEKQYFRLRLPERGLGKVLWEPVGPRKRTALPPATRARPSSADLEERSMNDFEKEALETWRSLTLQLMLLAAGVFRLLGILIDLRADVPHLLRPWDFYIVSGGLFFVMLSFLWGYLTYGGISFELSHGKFDLFSENIRMPSLYQLISVLIGGVSLAFFVGSIAWRITRN